MTTRRAPYDNYVAIIRTSIFVSYMVTNAIVWRHDTGDKINNLEDGEYAHSTER